VERHKSLLSADKESLRTTLASEQEKEHQINELKVRIKGITTNFDIKQERSDP